MALDASILLRIRLLSGVPDAAYGPGENEYLFSDDEIEAFYEEGFQNAKCAAGLIKQSVGASEAFLLKVVKNYETSTNGAALMKEWTAAGTALYETGLDEVAAADEAEGIFEIAYPEFGLNRHPEGYTHGSYEMGGWM